MESLTATISYFLGLSLSPDVLWLVVPLFISTIVMLVYFEKYRDEQPGWNTHVANSLILLFVYLALFRYLYSLDGNGSLNFVLYLPKFVVSLFVLFLGILILSLNFNHFLPEKLARNVSSPLTINLIAFIAILYVYSDISSDVLSILISLLILLAALLIILNGIRIPLRSLFMKLARMKQQEKIAEIRDEQADIKKKKEEITKEERLVRKEKQKIQQKERVVKKKTLQKLKKQRTEAARLRKIVTKN